jgi:hypothetical protein
MHEFVLQLNITWSSLVWSGTVRSVFFQPRKVWNSADKKVKEEERCLVKDYLYKKEKEKRNVLASRLILVISATAKVRFHRLKTNRE